MNVQGVHSPDAGSAQDAGDDAGLAFGTFSFAVESRTVTWTGAIFAIYGFEPSEIVPSLELMSAHQHPDDRGRWLDRFRRLLAEGGPFCWQYRIIDARRVPRNVIATGRAVTNDAGRVTEVRGYLVDLTESYRQQQAAEVTRAVQQSAATRSTIDQAKGLLMACFDLTNEQAFDLLRLHSSHANIKLRDVAETLVDRIAEPDLADLTMSLRVASILNALTQGRVIASAAAVSDAGPLTSSDPARARTAAPSQVPAGPRATAMPHQPSDSYPVGALVHAIDDAGLSITIADFLADDHPLVYVNPAFVELTGYPADEVLGRNCRFLQGRDTDPEQVAAMSTALAKGQEVRTVLRNYRRDGSSFFNELHLSAVRDETGRLTHYIGYQADASERVERERQLHQLAYFDADTGLPNRAHALMHLETLMAANGAPVVLVHVALPAAMARPLRAGVPATAMVAKLTGDAFLVIQSGAAVDLADVIVDAVGNGDRIGRVSYPTDGRDAAELLALAESRASEPN